MKNRVNLSYLQQRTTNNGPQTTDY